MFNTNQIQRGRSVCKLCARVLVAAIAVSAIASNVLCQSQSQSSMKHLYNEMYDTWIWLAPSQVNPNGFRVLLPTGESREVAIGGVSFYGTTTGRTSNQGSSSCGTSVSSDGRTLNLLQDGRFEIYIGGVGATYYGGGDMYSASISAESASGYYGIYRNPQTGAHFFYFFYLDGRWGWGVIQEDGKIITDKGLFQR